MKTRREFLKFFGKAGLVMGAIALHPPLAFSKSKPGNFSYSGHLTGEHLYGARGICLSDATIQHLQEGSVTEDYWTEIDAKGRTLNEVYNDIKITTRKSVGIELNDWIHIDHPQRYRGYWHVKGHSKNGIVIEPSKPNAEETYKISNPAKFTSK